MRVWEVQVPYFARIFSRFCNKTKSTLFCKNSRNGLTTRVSGILVQIPEHAPLPFFCNISLFGNIFAHFFAVSQKNKTLEKKSENLKRCVVMRFSRKKRITFAWYTKVIPQVSVCYQKVLCYKVCATKRYIEGGEEKQIAHNFALYP